jgi:hypothetical protein
MLAPRIARDPATSSIGRIADCQATGELRGVLREGPRRSDVGADELSQTPQENWLELDYVDAAWTFVP